MGTGSDSSRAKDLAVGGGWARPYPGRRVLRQNMTWPFGRLLIDASSLTFSAVWPLGLLATVVVPFTELERVERVRGLTVASRLGLLRFRTMNRDHDGITFTSFPSRVRAVEQKLEELGIAVADA